MKIQGIFPKRKNEIAENLGNTVSTELLRTEDILAAVKGNQLDEQINAVFEKKIDVFLNEKLSKSIPMLSMFIGNDTKQKIKGILLEEIKNALPETMENIEKHFKNTLNIKEIVKEKVIHFSTDKLEELLHSILKKEFRFIEVIGAVLGFIIGLFQVLMIKIGMI